MNAKQIWQTTLERLQTRVQPAVFTTWFQGTSAGSFQNGIFVVHVPTTFARAHLEGRFLDIIRSLLTEITGGPVEVQFMVAKDVSQDQPALSAPPEAKRPYRPPKIGHCRYQVASPFHSWVDNRNQPLPRSA